MQHIQGWVENGNTKVSVSGLLSVTLTQKSFPLSTVTVYMAGTVTPALIYSDNAGTALGNPFTAGSDGTWEFFAKGGFYDVVFSGTGISAPFTLDSLGANISAYIGPAYISAVDYPGSDFGVQVANAIAALPAAGGTVDARGFTGTQVISTAVPVDRPVVLLVGAYSILVGTAVGFQVTAGVQVWGAGRESTIFTQTGVSFTVFSVDTPDPCSFQDLSIRSSSRQTSGAGISITSTAGGPDASSQTVISHNIFHGQWVAVDCGRVGGIRIYDNQIQGLMSRGIRINNTFSGDEGDNYIHGNAFATDLPATSIGQIGIELIAGGGLMIDENKFFSHDIAIAINWDTSANTSQLSINDNHFEPQISAGIKFNRALGATGTLAGITINDNFMRDGPINNSVSYFGTLIWFATNVVIWTSGIEICGNNMSVGDAAIGILFEGGGVGDLANVVDNLISGGGTSTGVVVGTGYTQMNVGINTISVGTGGPYVFASTIRSVFTPDKLGVGTPSSVPPTKQILLPKNTAIGARDSTNTQQFDVIGTDLNDHVLIGDNSNIVTKIQGPLIISSDSGVVNPAQINYVQRLTSHLVSSPVAGNTTAEQTYTITGLDSQDTLIVQPPFGMPGGLGIVGVRVGTDTLALMWVNATAGPLTPVTGDYTILAIRAYPT